MRLFFAAMRAPMRSRMRVIARNASRFASLLFTVVVAATGAPSGAAAQQIADVSQRAPVVSGPPDPVTGLVPLSNGKFVAPDIARIVTRGTLIVAMNSVDTYPFFSGQGDALDGIDVRLMKGLAKELGVSVKFDRSAKSFDGVVDIVARGGADVGISKLANTLDRSQRVVFSEPYMHIDHGLLINRHEFAKIAGDQPLPAAVRNFSGTMGVLKASAWEEFARQNFPNAKIVPFATWEGAIEATKRGEIVAAYRDEYEVRSPLKADPTLTLTLRTVTFADMQSHLSIPVNFNDRVLLAYINNYLAQRRERPRVDEATNVAQKGK